MQKEKNDNAELVSIITVCRNSEATIRTTIESVLEQTYDNIEYILIDGASTDETVNIIKSYEKSFADKGYGYVYISEPDEDGFGSKSATRKFLKWVEEYDPDVIWLHNIHGYYINIEMLFDYLKKAGKKVYWTLHDCWSFTGHCAYYTYAKCDKWKTRCCECKLWNTHQYLIKKEANYNIVCRNCGKQFVSYGNKERKYCCHACYIQDRFEK